MIVGLDTREHTIVSVGPYVVLVVGSDGHDVATCAGHSSVNTVGGTNQKKQTKHTHTHIEQSCTHRRNKEELDEEESRKEGRKEGIKEIRKSIFCLVYCSFPLSEPLPWLSSQRPRSQNSKKLSLSSTRMEMVTILCLNVCFCIYDTHTNTHIHTSINVS